MAIGKLITKGLAGAAGGALAWALVEPTKPAYPSLEWAGFEARMMIFFGLFLGAGLGSLSGWYQGSRRHLIQGAVLGAIFGLLGVIIARSIGSVLGGMFASMRLTAPILWRVIVLTPIGAGVGLGVGAGSLNPKRMLQGLIGGALGGACGGFLFDTIGMVTDPIQLTLQGTAPNQRGETGAIPRAIWFALTGTAIGLFIGLIEEASKSAWIRLRLGRNEGREWALDSPQMFIGRAENVHIPLFGDMNVAPNHAMLQRRADGWYVVDAGTPLGTGVNGQRVQEAKLMPGSVIQIGGFQLEFLTRGGPTPVRGPETYIGASYPMGGPQVGGGPQMPQQMPQPMPQAMPTQMPAPITPPTSAPIATPGLPSNPTPTSVIPTLAGMASMAAPSHAGRLVVMDGPLTGQGFNVQGPIEIGREAQPVTMPYDTMASRRHARIAATPSGFEITDLGSTNGTFVNGTKVSSRLLQTGDMIKIGGTTFRFES